MEVLNQLESDLGVCVLQKGFHDRENGLQRRRDLSIAGAEFAHFEKDLAQRDLHMVGLILGNSLLNISDQLRDLLLIQIDLHDLANRGAGRPILRGL